MGLASQRLGGIQACNRVAADDPVNIEQRFDSPFDLGHAQDVSGVYVGAEIRGLLDVRRGKLGDRYLVSGSYVDGPIIGIVLQEKYARVCQIAVAETVGYSGKLVFDTSKPDGSPRKLLDSSLILSLGWAPTTSFASGLAAAYKDFLSGGGRHAVVGEKQAS